MVLWLEGEWSEEEKIKEEEKLPGQKIINNVVASARSAARSRLPQAVSCRAEEREAHLMHPLP